MEKVVVVDMEQKTYFRFFKEIKLDFQTGLLFVRGDGWGAKERAKPSMTPKSLATGNM